MGFYFLHTSWLWALSLIAIPIAVHLFNLRRYKTVYFTNVRLLQLIQNETKAQSKLKEWLILLSRILFFTMLILAFAQPIYQKKNETLQSNNQRIVILIDNSFSMSQQGEGGAHLEYAKTKALEVLNAYPSSVSAMVASTLLKPEEMVFKSKDDAFLAVSQITVSPSTFNVQKAIEMLAQKLESIDNQIYRVYVLSDFQYSNFAENWKVPEHLQLYAIPFETIENTNVSLDTAFFTSPVHQLSEEEILVYRLTNHGTTDYADFKVELKINDSLKSVNTSSLLANSQLTDTIRYQNNRQGIKKLGLSISDFPVSYDNTLAMSYAIKPSYKIAIISGKNSHKILHAFFESISYFESVYLSPDKIDWSIVEQNELLVVSLDEFENVGISSALNNFVEKGGKVVVFLGEDSKAQQWARNLNIDLALADTSGSNMSQVNLQSRFLKHVMDETQNKSQWPKTTTFSRLNNASEWLIKSEDGQVIVGTLNKNRGSILAFTLPFNLQNFDFYQNPIFVPILYNFITQDVSKPAYFESNRPSSFYINQAALHPNAMFRIEQGNRNWAPFQRRTGLGTLIQMPEQMEAGTFDITLDSLTIDACSINYSRSESDSKYWSVDELSSWNRFSVIDTSDLGSSNFDKLIQTSVPLWYWFVVMSILFLILEMTLVKWFRRT